MPGENEIAGMEEENRENKIKVNKENLTEKSLRSWSIPEYYKDIKGPCIGCGKECNFTAEMQKEWYEVRKLYFWVRPNKCRDCLKEYNDLKKWSKVLPAILRSKLTETELKKIISDLERFEKIGGKDITLRYRAKKLLVRLLRMKQDKRKINPSALRAYDIRGSVGELIFNEDAFYIGKAFATKIIRKTGKKNPLVAVGRDGRTSSPALHKGLVEGMIEAGAKVKDVGIGPSPMLYFAVRSVNLDGGIMITGSHNPGNHNGFKMMYNKAPIFAEEIQEIGRWCETGDFEYNAGGRAETYDVKNKYIKALLEGVQDKALSNLSNMRVAWDPGNGAGGEIVALLTQQLAGKHFVINEKIDGAFPAHHPDPSEEKNLQQLIELVKKENCDIGIAFDGDADRIGAVDGKGRVIWGDQLMMFFAEDVLEENPGAEIIVDVKASETFFDRVRELGGKPLMWKTGHSYIKTKLAETGAKLAGEMSGHIFFNDRYFGFDDAIYSAVRLLNFFSKRGISPATFVDNLPKSFASSEYRIAVKEEDKVRIVEEIRAKVKATGKQVSEIDGIRVKEDDGWWLLRSSNTQSVITIRAESTTEAGLAEIKQILDNYLKPYYIALNAAVAGH